jgi:hypothetical protein
VEAPESTGGRVASAFGIVAAGAAIGGAAGYAYMPASVVQPATGSMTLQAVGAAAGAVAGAMLAGIVALGVSELVDQEDEGWIEVERMAGLIGAGGVGLFGAVGLAKQLAALKAAPGATPQLPAASPGVPAEYAASVTDSGRSLVLAPGDKLNVTLPSATGSGWDWTATAGLLTLTGADSSTAGQVVYTLTAGNPGTGQAQATTQGATFTLNVTVVAPTA